jgi:hypothetical protein
MSTPSKKRRKAREWMQKEVARREAVESSFAYYRKDVQALYAREDRRDYDEKGQPIVMSTIPKFPDPRADGPVARYAMPFVVTPRFTDYDRIAIQNSRSTEVRFRAIEYGYEQVVAGSRSILRWFNWEPESGNPELVAKTRTFRDAMGKLSRARYELEMVAVHYPEAASAVVVAASAIEATTDDLRRVLGRFEVGGGVREERREQVTW